MPGSSTEHGLVLLDALTAALAAAIDDDGRRSLLCHPTALLLDQILKIDRIEVVNHDAVQTRPQIMRHATLIVVAAVFLAAALRRVERLVDCVDDVGDGDIRHRPSQRVAPARTARALNERMAAQLAEQLLEV